MRTLFVILLLIGIGSAGAGAYHGVFYETGSRFYQACWERRAKEKAVGILKEVQADNPDQAVLWASCFPIVGEAMDKAGFALGSSQPNPLTSDGFINDTLEHLRQTSRIAISRGDEQQIEQTFTDQKKVKDFLHGILASSDPVPYKQIEEEAEQQGFTRKQLRTAKQKLGITSNKDGLGGPWMWQLKF